MTAQIRKYETVVVSRSGLGIEEREALHKKVTDIIQAHSGDLVVFEVWGKRRLAYTIKKNQKGFYTYYVYAGDSSTIGELNSMLRLREDVLRYLTINLSDSVDASKLDEERNLEEFTKDDAHGEFGGSAHGEANTEAAAPVKVSLKEPVAQPVKEPVVQPVEATHDNSRREDA